VTEVTLIEINARLAQALAADPQACESQYSLRLGENTELVRHAVDQTLDLLNAAPRNAPWGGYLAVEEDTGRLVGTCGFKTGPQPDGTIEIAYLTFPSFEGRSVATTMAGHLLEMAHSSDEVREVIAHTLPVTNASTRVLEKLGMQKAGEVIDPEDGPVWRWSWTMEP
jgi:RimJ/RimL family protein N-acetyltransferase